MGRKNFLGFGICGCTAIVAMAVASAPALAQQDDCSAGPTVAVDGSNAIDTTAATTDGPDGTDTNCAYNNTQIHNDVWFVYTPTCTGFLNIDLCGGAGFGPDGVFYDSRVAVYDGTTCPTDATTLIICNDDGAGCPNFSSALNNAVPVTAGSDVLIRVGGFGTTDSGTGTMGISCFVPPSPPANDDCVNAAVAVDGSNPVDTNFATTDGPGSFSTASGCNNYGFDDVDNDIWYIYTPTCTGTLEIDLCGGSGFGPDGVFYDSRVAVYDGTTCPTDQSTLIACNDDGPGCPSFSSALGNANNVFVNAGSDVLIRVGGFSSSDSGTGTMGIFCQTETCGDGLRSGNEECDGADASACAAGCTPSCACLLVTVPALPPIGLIGLAIILLTGGALIFAWRPVRAEAGNE